MWLHQLHHLLHAAAPRGCISCSCISCAKEKLQQILARALVQQPQVALADWERLLPRAEALQQSGRSTREAWGQVAEEFPEFRAGRKLPVTAKNEPTRFWVKTKAHSLCDPQQ